MKAGICLILSLILTFCLDPLKPQQTDESYIRSKKSSISNISYQGSYNLSTDEYITQQKLITLIKQKLYPYCFVIKIPKYIPILFLGERYKVIDQDLEISNSKLKKTGFKIKYNKIDQII